MAPRRSISIRELIHYLQQEHPQAALGAAASVTAMPFLTAARFLSGWALYVSLAIAGVLALVGAAGFVIAMFGANSRKPGG